MASMSMVKLLNRKLLRISGPDCYPYLQGLLCNDLRYLYEPERVPKRKYANNTINSMSTFMLNPQGRAICDLLLYRTPMTRYECEFTPPGKAKENDELWIECDSNLASGIANTLYGYRVRRKVALKIEDSHSIYSIYPRIEDKSDGLISDHESELARFNPSLEDEMISYDMTLVNDPRLRVMGLRLITTKSDPEEAKKSLSSVLDADIKVDSHKDYTLYRYYVGLGEGAKDHLESECLPLECNADHLGSVSFDKGCYLGQELTARIKYTGVIRKRLMPIKLNREPNKEPLPLLPKTNIVDTKADKRVGVVRHVTGDKGLALMRYDFGDSEPELVHEDTRTHLSTYVPFWWKQNLVTPELPSISDDK